MKWSIDFVVRAQADVAAALKARAALICENIALMEKRQFGHADYVPDLERMAKAVQAIAGQLPAAPGKILVVNVLGEIAERNGELVDAGITVKIDLRPDRGEVEQAERHAAEGAKAATAERKRLDQIEAAAAEA